MRSCYNVSEREPPEGSFTHSELIDVIKRDCSLNSDWINETLVFQGPASERYPMLTGLGPARRSGLLNATAGVDGLG